MWANHYDSPPKGLSFFYSLNIFLRWRHWCCRKECNCCSNRAILRIDYHHWLEYNPNWYHCLSLSPSHTFSRTCSRMTCTRTQQDQIVPSRQRTGLMGRMASPSWSPWKTAMSPARTATSRWSRSPTSWRASQPRKQRTPHLPRARPLHIPVQWVGLDSYRNNIVNKLYCNTGNSQDVLR